MPLRVSQRSGYHDFCIPSARVESSHFDRVSAVFVYSAGRISHRNTIAEQPTADQSTERSTRRGPLGGPGSPRAQIRDRALSRGGSIPYASRRRPILRVTASATVVTAPLTAEDEVLTSSTSCGPRGRESARRSPKLFESRRWRHRRVCQLRVGKSAGGLALTGKAADLKACKTVTKSGPRGAPLVFPRTRPPGDSAADPSPCAVRESTHVNARRRASVEVRGVIGTLHGRPRPPHGARLTSPRAA